MPDKIKEEMVNNYDLFLDYHIDALHWIDFPYPWEKYFNKIPKVNITSEKNKWGKYLCFQLLSGSSLVHRVESWYIDKLISDASKRFPDYTIYLISTPETNDFYKNVVNLPNIKLFNGSIYDVCDLVLCSLGGIYTDSAWRLLSHSMELPTVTLSKDCQGYAGVPWSHKIRWLCWPQFTFNNYHNSKEVLDLFEKLFKNRLYQILPTMALNNQPIEDLIIKRDYKVSEKSILNS